MLQYSANRVHYFVLSNDIHTINSSVHIRLRPCSFQWEIWGVGWVSMEKGEGVGESW